MKISGDNFYRFETRWRKTSKKNVDAITNFIHGYSNLESHFTASDLNNSEFFEKIIGTITDDSFSNKFDQNGKSVGFTKHFGTAKIY